MKLLLALVISLIIPASFGQPDDVATEAGSDNEPLVDQTNTQTNKADDEATSTDAASRTDNTLGDAFKNFRPSEEISADNPVPFPVDI